MCVGNAEYLYVVMAATIVIHAAVGTFFGGVMTQRNILQIAHAVMGAHHQPGCHGQIEQGSQYDRELFQHHKINLFTQSCMPSI